MLYKRKEKLAIVHIALKETGIGDEAYRGILSGEGLTSAADMNEAQFAGIMRAFKRLGFVYIGKPAHAKPAPDTAARAAERIGGTEWQAARIRKLWTAKARNPSFDALRKFVKRVAHVDAPAWLDMDAAQKALVALEKMRGRE
jgi:phage gp16-like protein